MSYVGAIVGQCSSAIRIISLRRLVVVVLVLAAASAFLLNYLQPSRHGPFWEKYQEVRIGMKKSEVVELLGTPADCELTGSMGALYALIWHDGQQTICVQFSGEDDTSLGKIFLPRTSREEFWYRVERWRGELGI